MRKQGVISTILCLLFLLPTLLVAIPNCGAQTQSGLSVTYTEYGQKTVENNYVTDTEKGLALVVNVANTGSQELSIYSLLVTATVQPTTPDQNGQLPTIFTGNAPFVNLNLMPGQSSTNTINVTTDNSNYWVSYFNQNLNVGSYTAEVTYTASQSYGGSSQPVRVSPYPLDFSVVSPSPSPTSSSGNLIAPLTQIFNFNLIDEIISGVIVAFIVAAITALVYRRRKH